MIKKFINLYIEGFRNIGNTGKQLVGILFFKILIFFRAINNKNKIIWMN